LRLYSRTGATSVHHGGQVYTPGDSGGFDFPDHVSDVLHPFAVRGQRLWETDIERQQRILTEEMDRRRDPAELYAAVAKIAAAADALPAPKAEAKGRAKAAVAD
jgi:hypothetical protein